MTNLYDKLIRPLMFRLPAETAHEIGMLALRRGLVSAVGEQPDFGPITRFGLEFRSPLGMAAGFDKNGVVVNQLARLGFGFVEVGTVTHEPQPGNKRPRIFRLPKDEALINRLGFNNDGAAAVAWRLGGLIRQCVVGINIGKNKNVPLEAATENYLKTFETVHPLADYIAVNVSSPNTPNLRELQKGSELESLLSALQRRNEAPHKKPLLVKIAPDLHEGEIEMIVDVCLRNAVDGVIATNTTTSRTGLKTSQIELARIGSGGLSGRPLTGRSTEIVSLIHKLSKGKLTIIGVGGVFSPEDAFDKIAAGASLIQAYTGFIYHGPTFAHHISQGLDAILRERGFSSVDDAVGSAAA
jgi:dihydroorotate dehydrogenase